MKIRQHQQNQKLVVADSLALFAKVDLVDVVDTVDVVDSSFSSRHRISPASGYQARQSPIVRLPAVLRVCSLQRDTPPQTQPKAPPASLAAKH